MPGRTRLPVGTGSGGRASRDARGRFGGGGEVVLRETDHGTPQSVPDGTDPRVVEVYLQLWQAPVSSLWRPEDAPLALRLAMVRVEIEREGWASGTFTAAAALETKLLLTPMARAVRKVHIEQEQAEVSALDSWSKRRRERPPFEP